MKNKIKNVAYGAAGAVMILAPMVAGAQFQKPTTGLPDQGIFAIITNIMNWLLMAVGVIAVIGFAIAGILYLTAAGDQGRIDQAKSAMMYSIIGIIVALAGIVAINFAQGLLGAQSKF
jgi:hypothetical protein